MPPARKKAASRKASESKPASSAPSVKLTEALLYVATLVGGLGAKEKVERILAGKEEE